MRQTDKPRQPDLFAPTPAELDGRDWPPTRDEGLRRLAAFAPKMGGIYKARRNFDFGPDDRSTVSMLSPYVRRRLVSERECVSVALSAHGPSACEKFVQEVFWRTYWKGWLEMRPSVWRAYRDGLVADYARLAADRRLAKQLGVALDGATGIDCFDAWAAELVETGYLHNHTRMWFASIWIFTLQLPWRLGADFFLRHLLDGDAASNTLGWRWVAGLQTHGKNYVAAAWNIEKFTGRRFNPDGDLAKDPPPLVEHGAPPPASPPRSYARPPTGARAALLLTEEDLALETTGMLEDVEIVAVAALPTARLRSEGEVSAAIEAYDHGAFQDAAARLGRREVELLPAEGASLAAWARDAGAEGVLTPFAPVGWTLEALDAARPALAAAGLPLWEAQRTWDTTCWPAATSGFFKFKAQIPAFRRELQL